jgi:hypothetical protein
MPTYTTHVTAVEIHGATGLAAKVEAFDEAAAKVEIKGPTSASDWQALSAAILDALRSMKLTGDE